MLKDIDKNTVPFRLNFDGSLQEPDYLPSVVPNLLINGSSGIAVGMATNLLPHNLTEVGNGIIELVKNPEATVEDLLKHLKGPDFPGGGIIWMTEDLKRAYETGRGKVMIIIFPYLKVSRFNSSPTPVPSTMIRSLII